MGDFGMILFEISGERVTFAEVIVMYL